MLDPDIFMFFFSYDDDEDDLDRLAKALMMMMMIYCLGSGKKIIFILYIAIFLIVSFLLGSSDLLNAS